MAGVVAAGLVALKLADGEPIKAVGTFVLTLFASFLVVALVKFLDPDVPRTQLIPGLVLIWAATGIAVAMLVAACSACTIGYPPLLAAHLNCVPADAKMSQKVVTLQRASTPARPSPVAVSQTFELSDSSDDCGVQRDRTVQLCLDGSARVVDWSGPALKSANCGSTITNLRRHPDRPDCLLAEIHLRGCGTDKLPLGIRNCRGRGWVAGSITVRGERQ